MLAKIQSATLAGVAGERVTVEVHVSAGLPGFTIVGLPDVSCREARDRVRAALLSSGFRWPNQRMTVNLAPSNIAKVGTALDLAIAVGLLVADEQLELDTSETAFLGELGLDGTVRSVPGALPMCAALDTRRVALAADNAGEADALGSLEVAPLVRLSELNDVLLTGWPSYCTPVGALSGEAGSTRDLSEVRGHKLARFALEVAAAGGHHVLMVGPPGAGKTMLAERLPTLCGQMAHDVALEASMIHSAAGERLPPHGLMALPPFRAPHHTASRVALIGGGSRVLRPGEVSLAHGGVLFLDELGEFPASVLDALRQPLEEGLIRISRAHLSATMPARFQLVAAMNPCPCGLAGSGHCRCSEAALQRYGRRLSGPLLDRFDIRLRLSASKTSSLLSTKAGESSAEVAERVSTARSLAHERGVRCNAELSGSEIERFAPLTSDANDVLSRELDAGLLTGRGLKRIRALSLTLADLSGLTPPFGAETVAAALALRSSLEGAATDVVAS